MLHKLSLRQYKRLFGIHDEDQLEQALAELELFAGSEQFSITARKMLGGLRSFLIQVDDAYQQADRDLALGKLSLELSSAELVQLNETLRQDAEQKKQVLQTLRNTVNQLLMPLGKHLQDDSDLESLSQLLSGLVQELLSTRKDLEGALEKVQNQQFALDQHAIVSVTDASGIILYANEKFCQISQYPAHELVGNNHRIVNSGLHSEAFFRNLWLTISSGKVWHGEIRNKTKSGSFYWTNATIVPFLDGNHQPYQYISIRTDISEQLRLREKIESSQTLLQNVMNTLGQGIYTLDVNGCCTYLNPEGEKILGRRFGEVQGKILHNLIHSIRPDGMHVPDAECPISLATQSGEVYRSELEYFQHQSGILFPVSIVASPIYDNDVLVGSVAAFKDISERIAVSRALKDSEAKQRMLLDNAADAVFVADSNECWIYVNDLALDMLGYRREELIGTSMYEVLPPKDRPAAKKHFLFKILSEKALRTELTLSSKSGQLIPVELNAALLPDGSIYGSCRDITERLRFEADLVQAKNDAESANKAKSDFLATVSHEIRTPMNGIIGMTELALDTTLTAEQREYLELVRLSSQSLMSIINDILDFSKIESGKVVLERIDFSLRELIAATLKGIAVHSSEKAIELVYKIDPAIPEMLAGDPGRLRQIMVNLVGNAIKFSDAGDIIIDAQLVHENNDWIDIYFSVTDHGIGIPKDKQATIFSAFSQVDASTTRKYGGTGLGLSISSRLVQCMNGLLEVNSEPGKGSTFYFTARFGKADELLPMQKTVNLSGLHALIVDDNAVNRLFFSDTLKKWEMQTTLAASGQEALTLIEQQAPDSQFDAVLLDVCMPEMNGFDFWMRLHDRHEVLKKRIILLSSAGSREDFAKCQELGVQHYITKPVSQSELYDAVVSMLAGGKERHEELHVYKTVSQSEDMPSLRILLVEDNLVNQKLVLSLLNKWGFVAIVAENGLIALEKFSQEPFDVILMDMQMPKMGGIEATQRIRQTEAERHLSRIPIIAMTANAMPGDWERCQAAGMDQYVSKPIKAELLRDLLIQFQTELKKNMNEKSQEMESAASLLQGQHVQEFDYDKALLSADVEIVRIIGDSFLEACPQYQDEIMDAIQRQDSELLYRSAHTLKGLVGNFGAEPVEFLARDLELSGKNNRFQGTTDTLQHLLSELALMNLALRKFLASQE